MCSLTPAASTLRWLSPLRLLGVATIVGVLASGQQFVVSGVQGERMPWPIILVLTLPFWYIWALLTPVVVRLANRVPIQRAGLPWRVLLHAAFALALSLLHSSLHVGTALALAPLIGLNTPGDSGPALAVNLNWVQLSMNLLVYGVILGVAYAADFYIRFQERERVTAALRAQLAQAQLHALRMQLNPHFLFNAMNTIAMLVRQEKNADAVDTIAGLSDLLRYVLEETRPQEVPLRTELEFIEQYLAIEQVRFSDRLRTAVHGDADTLDAHVPNLILQPVVENAIRHGIAQRVGAGRVEITAHRRDGRLILQVTDDGPGVRYDGADSDGVGLANTRARLEQLYGSAARLELRNAADTGATAVITLPYHTAPIQLNA